MKKIVTIIYLAILMSVTSFGQSQVKFELMNGKLITKQGPMEYTLPITMLFDRNQFTD